ncbi:MAG: oligogalacturonate lyase family protein [Methyloceanibacter sp.]
MTAGKAWPSELRTYEDRRTGVVVRQLTNYPAHSHHFYFTHSGWYANESKLLVASDRENKTDLFSIDLQTYAITQLTDLTPLPLPREVEFLRACTNPVRDEAYFWYGYELVALDLSTLAQRPLYRMPDGYDVSMISCSADGRYVYCSISEDMSDKFRVDLLRGYVGFRETWAAMPHNQIVQVAVDGSGHKAVWEENYWVGHVNTSPRHPHLLTFCHEGPWGEVDNRIWGLNADTGEVWQIRPRAEAGEMVGHEYWHADGEMIGYHGRYANGRGFFGHVRYDNSGRIEVPFETIKSRHGHFFSNDFQVVVSDVGPTVDLWRWNWRDYGAGRVLCSHDSSFKTQQQHVHPRFNSAGTQVVFTSDVSGYGNVYLVDVPDFDSMPLLMDEIKS